MVLVRAKLSRIGNDTRTLFEAVDTASDMHFLRCLAPPDGALEFLISLYTPISSFWA